MRYEYTLKNNKKTCVLRNIFLEIHCPLDRRFGNGTSCKKFQSLAKATIIVQHSIKILKHP